ncbi:MAG: hypothetical protein FWE14_10380 [Lachnospiraceae bacterium]|nr:hypothetical protein [Lachnospiraceae bacterium]
MIINNPISVQGQITRATDLSIIKQNEANRGFVEQLNIQKVKEDDVETKSKQVSEKEDTDNEGQRHDAKDKGKNQYFGNGGKGRKKPDGVIIKKGPGNTEIKSFDIKI